MQRAARAQVPALQAASAVGQGRLFAALRAALRATTSSPPRRCCSRARTSPGARSYVNARNTLRRLLTWGVVPVVNENDTTATDEIRFGDNDVLAAQVAIMLRADLLRAAHRPGRPVHPDPRKHGGAQLVRRRHRPGASSPRSTSATRSRRGAGGMRGKTAAALMAAARRRAHRDRQRLAARRARRRGRRRGRRHADPRAAPRRLGLQALAALRQAGAWYARGGRRGRARPGRSGGAACFRWASPACTASSRPATPWPSWAPDGGEVARGLADHGARDLRRVARPAQRRSCGALIPHLDDEVVHRDHLVLVDEEAR